MPLIRLKQNQKKMPAWMAKYFFSQPAAYALIWATGLLLYCKSLFFNYTYLDDNALILNSLPFLQNAGNLFKIFGRDVFNLTDDTAAYYRPLLTLSFMPDAMLGGALPVIYHLTNILLHLLAASLVFKLLTKLQFSKRLSLVLSLIFTVHPALTQAVSWIPGRNDSLLAIFVLTSFIFLINYTENKKNGPMFWSIIFFAAALFTKETALAMPLLFLFFLWFKGRLNGVTWLKFTIGWLVPLSAWLILRHMALPNPLAISATTAVSSLLLNFPAVIQFLGKAFFPFNLSVLPIIQDTTFLWGLLALLVVFILAFLQIKDKKSPKENNYIMIFGLLWFLVFLLPGFITTDLSATTNFFEHRLYLPIIGLLIFLAQSRWGRQLNQSANSWILPVWIFVIIIFFGLNFIRQNNFSGRFSFWENAVATSPHSPLAQKNLGAMYYLDDNYGSAKIYFDNALALNPYEPMVHNNLGLIYAGQRQFAKAEAEYLAELSFNPSYDSAHYNLGLLYYRANRLAGAAKQWQITLQINPDYQNARQALDILKNSGQKVQN